MVTHTANVAEQHLARRESLAAQQDRDRPWIRIPPAERVRSCLERREVVQAADVAQALSMEVDSVRLELDRLVSRGLVEVLRPMGPPRGRDLHELEYFRWIRQTDGDYVWQKKLLRQERRGPMLAHEAADARSLMNF